MHLDPKVFGPCLCSWYFYLCYAVNGEPSVHQFYKATFSRFGGDVAVGAMTIITRLSVSLLPCRFRESARVDSRSSAITLVQTKPDRVKKAFFTQFCTCVIYTTAFWLVVMIFQKHLQQSLLPIGELVTYSAWALRIYMAESSLLVSR